MVKHKLFAGKLPMNCLSVFTILRGWPLKSLKKSRTKFSNNNFQVNSFKNKSTSTAKQGRSNNGPPVATLNSFIPIWAQYEFSFEIQNNHFCPLFNVSSGIISVKSNGQIYRKVQKCFFGPQNDPCFLFWVK